MKEQKATIREGLTYDDVLLVPAYSEILPKDVNISTQFTKGIKINIPIVSSANRPGWRLAPLPGNLR